MIQEPQSKNWIVIIVAIISAAGLICAAIIGLGVPFAERYADNYFPPTQSSSNPVAPAESANQVQPSNPLPQSSQPTSIDKQYTGAQKETTFTETLTQDEVIVGSAWGFETTTGGCVAFSIKGASTNTFKVNDGVWEKFSNVTTSEQAEVLLQRYIDVLQNENGCAVNSIRVIRIP